MLGDAVAEMTAALDGLPDWVGSLIVFGAALAIAYFAYRYLFRFLTRLSEDKNLFWRSLVSRTRRPMMLLSVMLAMMVASGVAPVTDDQAVIIRRILIVALIVLVAQIASAALHIWMTVHLRRFELDAEDNLLARKHVTQSRILKRVADVLIVVVAAGAILMTFESVRQYGVSLLASAGAAGIIIGLALQTVLKNLIAGIQLALTQPIRIDDVLIVEDEWGRVEEITSTYVVIKIWDLRRLIVPLSYFIEQPFQNWTRESASIIGKVSISVDYTTPIEEVRRKAREIAENSTLWDGDVFVLQVVDFTETTMKLRVLVSARDAGQAWDLRCDVREKLVTWLQAAHPYALPRIRIETDRPAAERAGGDPGQERKARSRSAAAKTSRDPQ